jgi:hypothetical protein
MMKLHTRDRLSHDAYFSHCKQDTSTMQSNLDGLGWRGVRDRAIKGVNGTCRLAHHSLLERPLVVSPHRVHHATRLLSTM